MNFSTPLSQVPRIGPVFQKRLQKLGITNVHDLLFYFPREYEDFSHIQPIEGVKEGENICVAGKILEIEEQRTFRKRLSITKAIIQDKTGAIKVVWFNQPYLVQNLAMGDEIVLAGKVLRGKEGIYFSNPIFEKIQNPCLTGRQANDKFQNSKLTHVGRIVPMYPESTGVSSKWLRSIIKQVLTQLEEPQETIPTEIIKEKRLLPLKRALWEIHFPNSLVLAQLAKKRFAFEELFYILLFILSEREKIAKVKASPIPFDASRMKKFTSSLPFQLTDAQKKAAWHILKDLEKPRPMNRLLQGDVGSGKTVVAAMAALSVVKAGFQVAFMAPTEILVQQHFKTISQVLLPFRVVIGILTGKTDRFSSPKLPNDFIEISREKLLKKTGEGAIDVLIGTHALIQDKVKFSNLGLVIVDEQHRFGVNQRKKLLKRPGLIPHLLSLTATPIPRTLALTIYGDLDISLITELPKGRKKVETKIVLPQDRNRVYEFVREEVSKGHQAFIICPLIEKSEVLDLKNVKEEYENLSTKVFSDLKLAMLHGGMSSREKEEIMKRMKRGKIDILVSTSVVEVGVDIPNATVMMIEGADRFGLAQLHQFRGRVGRSAYQSFCFLITETNSRKVGARLQALVKLENAFELAELDLHLRGPGDFVGTKQWGLPDFAMEQLTNLQLVEETREAAKKILVQDVSLRRYPLLKARIEELSEKLHLE